jgi:hypothetical protein
MRPKVRRIIVSFTEVEAAALSQLERDGLWDRTTKRALARIVRSFEHVSFQHEKPKGEFQSESQTDRRTASRS